MANFNNYPGPGPFGPGPMGPPPGPGGMPLSLEQQFMYGTGSVAPNIAKNRINVGISEVKELPRYRFISRAKTRYKLNSNKHNIKLVNKWMRRYQIQKILLDKIDEDSKKNAGRVRVMPNISSDEIIEQLNKENTFFKFKPHTRLGKALKVSKFGKWLAKKEIKIKKFREKMYINRCKAKFYALYKDDNKRKDKLSEINGEISHRKNLLNGFLFHNYNINSALLGYCNESNNFYGLMPDEIDKKIVASIKNSNSNTNANTNNNTNTNSNASSNSNANTNTNSNTNSNCRKAPHSYSAAYTSNSGNSSNTSNINNDNDKIFASWSNDEFDKNWDIIDSDIAFSIRRNNKNKGMTSEQIKNSQELIDEMLNDSNQQVEQNEQKGRTR